MDEHVEPLHDLGQTIAARQAIEQLLYEYGDRADDLDATGIAALFANAELRSRAGHVTAGAEAIERQLARLFETASTSRHVITNVRVQVDTDAGSATSWALYTKWLIPADGETGEPLVDSTGRYHSGFRRVHGRWQFAFHQVDTAWRRKT